MPSAVNSLRNVISTRSPMAHGGGSTSVSSIGCAAAAVEVDDGEHHRRAGRVDSLSMV
jgi:hypothetical protein